MLLQKLTGIAINSLPTHVKKLVDSGMLIELEKGKYKINQFLNPFLSETDRGTVSKIIRSDESLGIKPIFNSSGEYIFFKVLSQIFPDLFVFPRMTLNAIFKYSFMKEELDKEEFRYFLYSQVDFCLTSTISYLPIVGFEVDNHYHDQDQQIVKDEIKNKIFERGGLPLIRIRLSENTTEQEIKSELLDTISDFSNQIKDFDDTTYFKLLENEVDLRSVFEIKNFK